MKQFFKREGLRYAMIGSGSWATALIKLLLNHQPKLSWYLRDERKIEQILKSAHNPSYLQSVYLDPKRLEMSSDLNAVVEGADVILVATPSAYFMDTFSKLNVPLNGKFIISAIKGFVDEKNLTIAEYFNQCHNVPFDRIGVIGGPCHAEEVSMERLSYLTLTSKYYEVASALCDIFACDYIKATPGTDIYGVEYSAALKNVYAVAAGICHGLKYGDNFQAVLLSNAIQEMSRLTNAISQIHREINDSAYLGDLLVTAYSKFSRNRLFGTMIGKGYSVKTAQLEMEMIAEGYYATKCIHEVNEKFQVNIPIVDAVYNILYNRCSPTLEIKQLTEKLS